MHAMQAVSPARLRARSRARGWKAAAIILVTAAGWSCGTGPAMVGAAYAQNPPGNFAPPPPGYRPPCDAVTQTPLRGAARGAAGGALIGAISGNAGRGAAIGAGVGGVASAARRSTARSNGACY